MRSVALAVTCTFACGRLGFDSGGNDGNGSNTIDAPHAAIDAPVFSLDSGECPPGYTSMSGCYKLGAAGAWLTAELACEADAAGAHLVVVDDAVEVARLNTLFGFTGHTWIGASKRQNPSYRTVVNTAPYLDLGMPQPEPSEDCLSIDSTDQKMYTHSCPDQNRYICEFDGAAAVPSSY